MRGSGTLKTKPPVRFRSLKIADSIRHARVNKRNVLIVINSNTSSQGACEQPTFFGFLWSRYVNAVISHQSLISDLENYVSSIIP
jgi:hypothetical protein